MRGRISRQESELLASAKMGKHTAIVPLIATAIGGAGAIGSALIGGSAARHAQEAIADANRDATNLQRAQFDYAQQSNAPWLAAGQLSLGQILNEMGLTQPGQTLNQPQSFGGQLAGGSTYASPSAGGVDWNAYDAADPGLRTEFNRLSDGLKQRLGIGDYNSWLQYHYNTAGRQEIAEGRRPELTQLAALTTPQAANSGDQVGNTTGTTPTASVPFSQQVAGGTQINPYSAGQLRPAIADRPALTDAPTYKPPEYVSAPGYVAPTYASAPGYVAPEYREREMKPLDVSQAAFEASPDYQIAMNAVDQDSARMVAQRSAISGLDSGDTRRQLQKIALQDTLSIGYNPFRAFTAGQWNTDRADMRGADANFNNFNLTNAGQVYNSGLNDANSRNNFNLTNAGAVYNSGLNDANSRNAFNVGNSQFGTNLAQNTWQNTNSWNQQNYNTDRSFLQDIFNMDRTNAQAQDQNRLSNLFAIAGLGQGATSSNIQAGQNYTSAAGQGLLSSATAQANAGLAGASLAGQAINSFTGGLMSYFGQQSASQNAPYWMRGGTGASGGYNPNLSYAG